MNIAVIFAGGTGKRMHTKTLPKQFLELNGKPIIIHTLEKFENHSDIDAISVVCIEEWIDYLKKLLKKFDIKKVKWISPGGESGQQSIYNGLNAIDEDNDVVSSETIVLIHDGVRPLITEDVISRNIEGVKKKGSSVTVTPANETVITIKKDGSIRDVPNRENCRIAKAPQSFYLSHIIDAHHKAINENKFDSIDSASLLRYYGHKVHTVEGNIENIKITTPSDFYIFRAILQAEENSQIFG